MAFSVRETLRRRQSPMHSKYPSRRARTSPSIEEEDSEEEDTNFTEEQILNRVVEDEDDYVESLRRAVEEYLPLFRQHPEADMEYIVNLTKLVFSNIEKLYKYHKSFVYPAISTLMKSETEGMSRARKFAKIFIGDTLAFEDYPEYVIEKAQSKALLLYDIDPINNIRTLNSILEPHNKSREELEKLLYGPIQRMRQYERAVQRLLKLIANNTQGSIEDTDTMRDLNEALKVVSLGKLYRLGESIFLSERIRGCDIDLDIVKQGELRLRNEFLVRRSYSQALAKCCAFLFQRSMILTQPQRLKDPRERAAEELKFVLLIPLASSTVEPIAGGKQFKVTYPESGLTQDLIFTAGNRYTCRLWVTDLLELVSAARRHSAPPGFFSYGLDDDDTLDDKRRSVNFDEPPSGSPLAMGAFSKLELADENTPLESETPTSKIKYKRLAEEEASPEKGEPVQEAKKGGAGSSFMFWKQKETDAERAKQAQLQHKTFSFKFWHSRQKSVEEASPSDQSPKAEVAGSPKTHRFWRSREKSPKRTPETVEDGHPLLRKNKKKLSWREKHMSWSPRQVRYEDGALSEELQPANITIG